MNLWVIYDHPDDFPSTKPFVARRHDGTTPTLDFVWGETLEDVRRKLPPGLSRMDRLAEDDPKIVEVWI